MKIVTIANQKGGVGKSTICCHLGWAAKEQGMRVLVIDMDGQMNTTKTLTSNPLGLTSSQLFKGSTLDPVTTEEGIGLIGADISTNDVESLPFETILSPEKIIKKFSADYDLCIIDTPPNLGRRLLASLIASDCVFTPLELSQYSLDGVGSLMETILTVKKKFNKKLVNLGLLPNLVNSRSKSQKETLEELQEQLKGMVLPFHMNNRVAVQDAIKAKKPVWKHGKGSSGVKAGAEMKLVVNEILSRVENI